MRTKTLLAAAILAAGIATSMAQSNVYSLNVVGYVNKVYDGASGGFHLIANPLKATNNTVAALFPNPPFFTYVYKYTAGSYETANGYLGAWDNPGQTLNPGDGAFLLIPSGENFTNTWVGEVLQGSLTNTLIPGLNLVGTKVPQAGGITAVHNLQPQFFDYVYQYQNHAYLTANGYLGAWDFGEPNVGVAEGFWYLNAQAGDNVWVRNFSVPTP
jgi:hypothetical protein